MNNRNATFATRTYRTKVRAPWGNTNRTLPHSHFEAYANAELVNALAALKPGETHSIVCRAATYTYKLATE